MRLKKILLGLELWWMALYGWAGASARAGEGEAPGAGAPSFRLVLPAGKLAGCEAVFLAGQRAALETFLREDRLGRSAFAPIDAFNSLQVRWSPALPLREAIYTPGRVEKEYAPAGGISALSAWQADGERPFFRIDYEIRNGSTAEAFFSLSVELTSNVGYVNKFAPHPDDLARLEGKRIIITDRALPRLILIFAMDPEPDRIVLDPQSAATPRAQAAALERALRIPPGESRKVSIVVAGTDDPEELSAIGPSLEPRSFIRVLEGAAVLETPEPLLDEFTRACMAWPAANVRRLPFGPPHGIEGAGNRTWPVITASPDYHGIFANDCIQTLREIGLLGPGLYGAARNSLETMLRFGPKESVEWWTGDGKVWMFPLPLGDTPQIILGAAWHLLWTGDRDLARAWWPDLRRCLAVLDANDSDGDSLEDRRNTPYPEQPDPGEFHHEMLYVQCFWRQAFDQAAAVAGWMGFPEEAEYREKARKISRSIEEKFGTSYGLGVWLNRRHEPHPHIGHEQVIAAAAGDVGDAKALQIIETATRPPVWTSDGPRRAEPGKGVAAGDHVWTFLRWKLVQAMFRLGQTDRALELALRWAAQERDLIYQAPEGFPAITGTTGKGYTWTAGRALRALVLGLTGFDLDGRGVSFAPRLPSSWKGFALRRLTVHGTRIDLEVKRGPASVLVDGKPRGEPRIDYAELLGERIHLEISIPEPPP